MKTLGLLATFFAFSIASAGSTPMYKRLDSTCSKCTELDKLASQHNTETTGHERLNLVIKAAAAIQSIKLKGRSKIDQQREIYYAMNASLQMLGDDFDSQTVVRLLDLRGQAPKVFDEVLWGFPLAQQNDLIGRMRSFKEDKIRPKAEIPKAKALE